MTATAPPYSGSPAGHIVFLRILPHHPAGGELRDERGHGAADSLNPFAWDALGVAFVKERDDFLRERLVKIGAIEAVLLFD